MADQLTTVSKLRLIDKSATLAESDMRRVEHVIRVQLGMVEISK